jgi:MFS family permease
VRIRWAICRPLAKPTSLPEWSIRLSLYLGFKPAARLYLLHAALLTAALSITSLLFNLLFQASGYSAIRLQLPIVGELSILGLANSLPTLFAALTSLPLWWLVGLIGPRMALIISVLLQAIFMLIVAVSTSWQLILFAALLTGPAAVLFQVSAAPLMMQHSEPEERDALFSLNAGLNIGVAGLGSLLGGFMPGWAAFLLAAAPQSPTVYRATFALAGILCLGAGIPLLLLRANRSDTGLATARRTVPPPGRADPSDENGGVAPAEEVGAHEAGIRSLAAWWAILRPYVGLLRFAVPPLLISCGAALFIPYLNLYFQQRYGVPDEVLGAIFAAIGLTTGAATLLAPLLSQRFGRMPSVVLTQSLAIPCLLLLGFSPLLALAVGVALARGALMNMASPLYDAEAMEQTPPVLRPTVMGMINGAFAAGYIVGPTISVEVQRRAGFTPIFVATAVCYAIAAMVTYWLFVRKKDIP